jgi:hypothetical protein
MKALFFRTYDSGRAGIVVGRWSHDRQYGVIAGRSGWYVTVTMPWFGRRYVAQLRRDIF